MMRSVSVAGGLVVLTALALPGAATAQMTLSIGGGIAASTFVGTDADLTGAGFSKGSRIGINVGANLSIPVADRVAVVTGAHYVEKGSKYTQGSTTATFKVDYIVVPVFASLMVTGGESSVGFSVFGGPTLSFQSSCNLQGEDSGVSASTDCDTAGLNERQKLDVGVAVGAGLSFPLTEELSLMLNGGLDLGLRTLDTSSTAQDFKNRTFFGGVAVAFPIG